MFIINPTTGFIGSRLEPQYTYLGDVPNVEEAMGIESEDSMRKDVGAISE
ncbi:MAG: hypothetical protein WBA41_12155 [Rivularia sp. (in: cyanobacteria)]